MWQACRYFAYGFVLTLVVGCVAKVGVGTAKQINGDIAALNAGARDDLAKTKGHTDPVGDQHVTDATGKLVQQADKIGKQGKELDHVGAALSNAQAEADKLRNSWRYRIGTAVLGAIWFVVGGWVLVQVVGGVLFGRGIGTKFIEPLLDALPGSNVGYWVADKAKGSK